MSLRQVRWSQGAWAVLCECRAGDKKWTEADLLLERHTNGDVTAPVDSTTYDVLIQRQRELGLGSISDTIVYLYRTPPSKTGENQC